MPPSPTRTSLKVGMLVFSVMMSRYSLEYRVWRWRWGRALDGLVTKGFWMTGWVLSGKKKAAEKIGISWDFMQIVFGRDQKSTLTIIHGDTERRSSRSASTARTVTASGLPMFFVFADPRGLILVGLFASTVEFVHHWGYLSLEVEILM